MHHILFGHKTLHWDYTSVTGSWYQDSVQEVSSTSSASVFQQLIYTLSACMCTIQGSGPISLKLVLSPVKQHDKHCDTTPDNVLGRVTLKTPASPYVDRAFFMLLKCPYKSPLPPPVFVHTSGQSPTSPSIYTLPHLRMGGGGQPDFYYIINYQFEALLSRLDIKWDSLASCETIIYQMMLMGPLPPSLFCFWEPEEKGMKDCVCLCVCVVWKGLIH